MDRAVQAYRDGRPVGQNGRPRYFTGVEEKDIEQHILEMTDRQESMSRYEIVDYVR